MNWLALKMLTGDQAKYLSLIFSVMFATLLMTQQISIFMGIVRRSASQVDDVRDADIWVMDAKTRQIDEAPNLLPPDVQRVRGVEGVEWAVQFHKGQAQARLENGAFRTVTLVAVDDASMVGAPRDMILGDYESLRQPDAQRRLLLPPRVRSLRVRSLSPPSVLSRRSLARRSALLVAALAFSARPARPARWHRLRSRPACAGR